MKGKGCPGPSYRKGTPRTNVCASASHRRHCLGTARALHHRRQHPTRAPLLPEDCPLCLQVLELCPCLPQTEHCTIACQEAKQQRL